MKFKLVADCAFEAENIDDAFNVLGKHFIALRDGRGSELLEAGHVEVAKKRGDEITHSFQGKNLEVDPHGKQPKDLGAKLDHGKVRAGLLEDFSLALEAVAQVCTYGAEKYSEGGWQYVPNGISRYRDAAWRHRLKKRYEKIDPPSGLLHEAQEIWNLLAVLELKLRVELGVWDDQNAPRDSQGLARIDDLPIV